MAKCKKCAAELAEGALFCESCGAPVEQEKPEKKSKLGLFNKKKENKTGDLKDKAPDSVASDDAQDRDADTISIEKEAEAWAKSTEDDFSTDLPTKGSTYAPDKRVVPSAVFIARNKNGMSDKFIGLLLFFVILAIIVMSFVLNPWLANAHDVVNAIYTFLPLLILSLGTLVIARTGSFDFGLPAITVITFLLLNDAYANQNIYLMMLVCLAAAVVLGLVMGVLSVIGKVPAVFSSVILLIAGITYISVIFAGDLSTLVVPYTETTLIVLPIALIAIAIIATFVLIYMTKLGKPLFKRKGLTGKTKLIYILGFGFAYLMAAGAGLVASVFSAFPLTLTGSIFSVFDLILGVLFVVALSGASTLFDNRSMPVLVALLNFIAWFGLMYVLSQSSGAMAKPEIAALIKIGFVALALIADRVYTKAHFADFYQTINVKK